MHGKEKDWLRALPAYQQACHLVRDSGEFKFDASGTPYNVKEQQAEEGPHGRSGLATQQPAAARPPLVLGFLPTRLPSLACPAWLVQAARGCKADRYQGPTPARPRLQTRAARASSGVLLWT